MVEKHGKYYMKPTKIATEAQPNPRKTAENGQYRIYLYPYFGEVSLVKVVALGCAIRWYHIAWSYLFLPNIFVLIFRAFGCVPWAMAFVGLI